MYRSLFSDVQTALSVAKLLRYADEFLILLVVPLCVIWLGALFQWLGENKRIWKILKYILPLLSAVWGVLRYNRIITLPHSYDGFGIGDMLFGLYWCSLAVMFLLGIVIRFLQKHLKTILNPEKYPIE